MAQRLHRQPAAAVQVGRKHRAQRHAIVRSRGLNKNMVDHARRLNFSVGFRVERHAAGQANVAASGFLRGQLHQSQHGVFAGVLHGEGDVLEAIVDFAFGRALGPKPLGDGGGAVAALKQQRRVDAIGFVIERNEFARDSRRDFRTAPGPSLSIRRCWEQIRDIA